MQFKSLAAATAVLAYAFQAAVADEVHLVNCYGDQTDGVVVYCANGVVCDSAVPSNDNLCFASSGSNEVWEGSTKSCTFNTGVTFTWDISSVGTYDYAGSASNGYETFSCYRDSDPAMGFTITGSSDTCYSIYYCLSN